MTGSESTTAIERYWLDWDRPMLPEVAAWLIDRCRSGDGLADMQRLVCVAPGRRAGRILLALLAEQCAALSLAFIPPRTMTPGMLADLLPAGDKPIATGSERILAWMKALRTCTPGEIGALLPAPPRDDDLLTWWELAHTIDGLHEELAGERLNFADVPVRAECLEMFAEGDRWRALSMVAARYRNVLASCELADPHEAQRAALVAEIVDPAAEIILIGVTELNAEQRAIVRAAGDRAAALIHAPASLADRFDAFGCVRPEAWAEAEIDLDDEQIVTADDPADQAQKAMEAIAALGGACAPDQITIGLGDASLLDSLTRAADWTGIQMHSAMDVELHRTGPHRLLSAIAAWLEDRRFAPFAALVRHPDLERSLTRRVLPGEAGTAHGITDWLTLLDRYFADHLHQRLAGEWLGEHDRRKRLGTIWNGVHELLAPLAGQQRPLGAWCAPILDVLAGVYDDLGSRAVRPHDRITIDACLALRDALARQASASGALQPQIAAAGALNLFLSETADEAVASEVRADQIEMLGWLELHLDPAPALVILGVNEGRIPEAITADPFLPDTLRRALGLMRSSERRYARDGYLLSAIRHSRERLTIIAGRTDARGEPLPPSRLLLACDDEALVRRIRAMCAVGEEDAGVERALPIGAPPPGSTSRFIVPVLPPGLAPPESMNVTDFRTYLACPYRYALQRLLGLEATSDDAAELNALQFGTLAHEVLERFGADETIRDSADARAIERYLLKTLRMVAWRRFGSHPMPAVRLQIAQLQPRLKRFAERQAGWRAEGWAIRHTEFRFDTAAHLDVPGEAPMPLRGRIDRIDYHEDKKRWRLIDYKTGERGESPFQVHHNRKTLPATSELTWCDLQLPLYHYIARQSGLEGDIDLAYIVLPRDADDVDLKIAAWRPEHLDAAIECARQIVRDIRSGSFAMNRQFASPFDEFARICQTFAFVEVGNDGDGPAAGEES
jgi:ATP-dependent helicase/nuclease subunit B